MMMLIAEGLSFLLLAGALLGPIVWIVLGLMTYAANTHSRNLAHEGVPDVADAAPPVSRSARPAKIVALTIAGLLCLIAASIAVSFLVLLADPWAEALGYAVLGMYAVEFALVAALVILLIAVLRDVSSGHRLAGRDAGVAYGAIATLHAVQIGALVALVMSGAQML